MGRTVNGGGDQLARGAAKVSFRQPDVTEKEYNDAVGGFNLERFLKGDQEQEVIKEPSKKERKRALR